LDSPVISRRGVVNERVKRKADSYKTVSTKQVKSFAFKGGAQAAQVTTLDFNGVQLEIYAPAQLNPKLHYHSVKEAAQAASKLPPASRSRVKRIVLNPVSNPDDAHFAKAYNSPGFESYMTAGAAGVVTVYPRKSKKVSQQTLNSSMVHETAHIWSKQKWGENTNGPGWKRWKAVMAQDKASISDYADRNINEDVAETIQAYAATLGTKRHNEFRAKFPNRFRLLDQEYK
jgi:hypothetical protein